MEDAGIQYVVTGSIVSSIYGEPRLTVDVDLVIMATVQIAEVLTEAFPAPRFHVDRADIIESLRRGVMFNVIDTETGGKIDFHPKRDDALSDSFFERRVHINYKGSKIWFPTPEDAILSKLVWARAAGESEKHQYDAYKIFELQSNRLDVDYLELWANRFGVMDSLERIRKRLSLDADKPGT